MTGFFEYWEKKETFANYEELFEYVKSKENALFDELESFKKSCKTKENVAINKVKGLKQNIVRLEKKLADRIKSDNASWGSKLLSNFFGGLSLDVTRPTMKCGLMPTVPEPVETEASIRRAIEELRQELRIAEERLLAVQSRNNENCQREENRVMEEIERIRNQLAARGNEILAEDDQRLEAHIVLETEEMRVQYNYMLEFYEERRNQDLVQHVYELFIVLLNRSSIILFDIATQIDFLQTRNFAAIRLACMADIQRLEDTNTQYANNEVVMQRLLVEHRESAGDQILAEKVQDLMNNMKLTLTLSINLSSRLREKIMTETVRRLSEMRHDVSGIRELIDGDLQRYHQVEDCSSRMQAGILNAIQMEGQRPSNNTNYQ